MAIADFKRHRKEKKAKKDLKKALKKPNRRYGFSYYEREKIAEFKEKHPDLSAIVLRKLMQKHYNDLKSTVKQVIKLI